jgi:hypothetical protein
MGKVKYLLRSCKIENDKDCQKEHEAHISYAFYKKDPSIIDSPSLRKIIIYKEDAD